MDIEKLRQEIIRKIEETENMELLLRVKDAIADCGMVNEPSVQYGVESDEDIVAYTVDGKPLTKAEYVADIELAEKDFAEGNYYTTNEVRKIVASWEK